MKYKGSQTVQYEPVSQRVENVLAEISRHIFVGNRYMSTCITEYLQIYNFQVATAMAIPTGVFPLSLSVNNKTKYCHCMIEKK